MSQTPSEPKKRGRPSKAVKQVFVHTDKKVRAVKKVPNKFTTEKVPDKFATEIKRLVLLTCCLNEDIEDLKRKINDLNNSIIGYKSVISYLEFHLDLRDSQGVNQE